jgi:2-polyprenyl-3-methyl-5-hydroxy-6-metoxy-1,4-benzoquinol methylase
MTEKSIYRKRIYERYTTDRYPQFLNFNEKAFSKSLKPILSRLKKWLPKHKKIKYLDVACGAGQLLYGFKKMGYEDIYGVDVSPQQVLVAKKISNNVFEGDALEFLKKNKNTFDLITAIDILEHLDKNEMFDFLDAIYLSLREGGRLILQMPNAESPFGHKIRYCDLTHENSFDPSNLSSILNIVGFRNFQVQECGPIIHGPISFFRWVIWRMISLHLKIWNLAETGNIGSGVYTRVFLSKVDK